MGRPKIVRKSEDAKNIPVDQPIQIELAPEGTVELKPEEEAARVAAEAAAATKKNDQPEEDQEKIGLKKQLEEMKATADEQRRLASEAAAREVEARKQAAEREKEYKNVVLARDQAEYDAVLNAISASNADVERAEQVLQQAGESQDWAAIAKAQAVIGRASARLVQLEDGKAVLEARAEKAKKEAANPTQPQAQTGDPVENHINSIQGLLPAQRDWLKNHRELMTDPRKNTRLQNAHLDAEDAGIRAGSEDYFKFLEERLGYRKAESNEDDDGEDNTARAAAVSAPPSRDVPSAGSGRPSPTRVTLTAEERAHAAASGISEIDYARNKLKLLELKKNGHYGTEH